MIRTLAKVLAKTPTLVCIWYGRSRLVSQCRLHVAARHYCLAARCTPMLTRPPTLSHKHHASFDNCMFSKSSWAHIGLLLENTNVEELQ
jgi:hypothetical protein